MSRKKIHPKMEKFLDGIKLEVDGSMIEFRILSSDYGSNEYLFILSNNRELNGLEPDQMPDNYKFSWVLGDGEDFYTCGV